MIDYLLEILDFVNLDAMPILNWVVFALELLYILIKFALLIFPAESKVGKFLRKLFVGYKALRSKINELEAQNKIKDDIINGKSDTNTDTNTDTDTDADTDIEADADANANANDNLDARTSNFASESKSTNTHAPGDFIEQLKRNRRR